jgi:hypothetical protein
MSAKNWPRAEESRPEIASGAEEVVSEARDNIPDIPEFKDVDHIGNACSGSELRELIHSLGGLRAAQNLLKHRRGLQVSTPPAADIVRLREVVRLLGKQHAAEHLTKVRKS